MEIWEPVKGFRDYWISNKGRVKHVSNRYRDRGGYIVMRVVGKRYSQISLRKENKSYSASVSVLVLTYFDKPRPSPLHQAAHNDGNMQNDNITNLRWATCKENNLDKVQHGTLLIGSRNPTSVLKESDIPEIFYLKSLGLSHRDIGEVYDVSKSTIKAVISKRNWKHITKGVNINA